MNNYGNNNKGWRNTDINQNEPSNMRLWLIINIQYDGDLRYKNLKVWVSFQFWGFDCWKTISRTNFLVERLSLSKFKLLISYNIYFIYFQT